MSSNYCEETARKRMTKNPQKKTEISPSNGRVLDRHSNRKAQKTQTKKNRPESRFFFKLESLVAGSRCRSGSRRACVRSSARIRSSSRSRACVSSRCRCGIRSSSRSRCRVSSRCRCSSRIACRSGALIARLAASSQSQCSHQGSEEEGFLHDHVLLWIKVSNSANVTGNVYVPNTDLGRWHRGTPMCPLTHGLARNYMHFCIQSR
jgi:hypothetical protein